MAANDNSAPARSAANDNNPFRGPKPSGSPWAPAPQSGRAAAEALAKRLGRGAARGLAHGVLAALALELVNAWFQRNAHTDRLFTPVGFRMLNDNGPDTLGGNPVAHREDPTRSGLVWVGSGGAQHPHLPPTVLHFQSSGWNAVQWLPTQRWHDWSVREIGTSGTGNYLRAQYENLMYPNAAPSHPMGGPLPQPVALPLEIPIYPTWWPNVDPMFIPINTPGYTPTPTPWPEIPNVWPAGVPNYGPDGSPADDPRINPAVDPAVDPWEWPWPGPSGVPGVPATPAVGWEFGGQPNAVPVANSDPHRTAPPDAGTRERKERMNGRNAAILLGIVNAITESVDAIEAFHDALPEHLQAEGRNPSPQDMLEALWRNWDAVNFQEAVTNLHEEAGEDAFWGWRAGRDAAAEAGPHGDLPFGFELGPADSGGPWIEGMFDGQI